MMILVSAGLIYTVILPQYHNVQAHRAEFNQYKSILANVSELTAKRDELLIKYQAIPKEEIDRLDKVLPDRVDTVKFALDLDKVGSKYGITLKSLKVSPVSNSDDSSEIDLSSASTSAPSSFETTTIEFSFVSTYDSFDKFMADIGKSLRIMNIQKLSFTSTEDDLQEFKVTVETYWLP